MIGEEASCILAKIANATRFLARLVVCLSTGCVSPHSDARYRINKEYISIDFTIFIHYCIVNPMYIGWSRLEV